MPSLSRRAFNVGLPSAAAALASVLSPTNLAAADQSSRPKLLAPSAQFRIGRFAITALADGFADMPFSYFPGLSAQDTEAQARAMSAAKPGGVRFLFNQYLVEDGDQLILIDTGPGGTLGQSGKLAPALAQMGVRPDAIDAVVITHTHQDHIGGLVAGGRQNFPNADVYVDRRDIRHWTDPAKRSSAPPYLTKSFDLSSDLVRLYPKLQQIDGEREIARGVSIVDLTGHTPGHIGVRIADAGQSLIMASDMLFPVVHPGATDVFFLFEQDRDAAKAMRDKFYPRAAEEKALVAATHMPFPGLGRIASEGGKLRWVAAEWAYQD
ncbi:MBL fold metallo-hydrolase [Alsobacter sp. KACC 23698]|uniref:MBL fold metallo-hydrolase n=1 Tax=Alsobacter sp. KACC 23698 TaxID=3149229 RepID=A0AAU7JK78_9HYPH